MEVAEALFAELGYEGTSTRMLASKAGINVAMLSYYFGSKEKLFEAVLEKNVGHTREKLLLIADADKDSWQKLDDVIELYVNKVFSNLSFHKIIQREMSLQQRSEMNDVLTSTLALNMQVVVKIIQQGQGKQIFRDVDVHLTIVTLFGTIFNLINSAQLSAKVMNTESSENTLCNDATQTRLKSHLKELMRSHLSPR